MPEIVVPAQKEDEEGEGYCHIYALKYEDDHIDWLARALRVMWKGR